MLDNCEHLIDASAQLVAAALAACPDLQVMATSREALNVPGELSWRVPPLEPADAVRLLLERAALNRTGLAANRLREQRVAELCQRLDGLPLALELAAVRLRTMPLEEIFARLDDRLRLLSTGSRTSLPRQQTLRATVDWSYELLAEPERALFRRLSVFIGGFDLAAAEAICGDSLNVLEHLPQLAERSMVQVEETPGAGARYRLLETLRQYGTEQLLAGDEVEKFRRRHAEYFLALAESGEWDGSGQASSARRLDTDQDNLRAALTWFAANDRVAQLRLAGSLGWFWILRAQNTEGRQQLEAALATSSDRIAHRAKALRWLAHLSRTLGDVALARRQLEEALTISEELHQESDVALTLLILGTTSGVQGDLAASRTFYERALAIYERLGDRTGVARMQQYLGIQAYWQGDLPRAQSFLEASLPGLREAKDAMFTAQVLALLGMLAVDHDHLGRATSLLAESLSISEPMANQFAITLALDALDGLAAAQHRHQRAMELAGAASAARDAAGIHIPPHLLGPRDRWLEPSRRQLGKRSSDQAWEQGRRLPVHEAIAYALHESGKISRPDSRTSLTRRENEIAELVSQGLTNRQIADRLVLSVRTAEGHVERIRDKLGMRSRAQIAAWFVEKQVVPSR